MIKNLSFLVSILQMCGRKNYNQILYSKRIEYTNNCFDLKENDL